MRLMSRLFLMLGATLAFDASAIEQKLSRTWIFPI